MIVFPNKVFVNSEEELKIKEAYKKFQTTINLVNDTEEELEFNELLNNLRSTIVTFEGVLNNPIVREIEKLLELLQKDGIGREFKEQLKKVGEIISEINDETELYEPINKNFIDFYNNHIKQDGISFLCDEIDRRTGGLQKGKLCTIVGGPGSMKTTYATNICYEAIKQGSNVCFLSLEETPIEIYSKLLSRVSVDLNMNLAAQDITQHKLSEQNEVKLKEEVYPYLEKLEGKFYLLGESDLGNYSQSTIESRLLEVDEMINKDNDAQNESNGMDLIVVDHLQMFKYVNSEVKDEMQIMNEYVSFFRKLSKKFGKTEREIAVILISQCNREGLAFASKNDGGYKMQHIAEASEIERASSYIISTYTDSQLQLSKLLKIGVLKLRGAALPMGTINVYAAGEYYLVGEVKKDDSREYKLEDISLVTTIDSDLSLDNLLGGYNL